MRNYMKNFYNVYAIDDKFRNVCKNKYTINNHINLNIMNPLLKIEPISPQCGITVNIKNRIINYPIRNITKALYGVSESMSIDVTSLIISYLNTNKIIDRSIDVNKIFGDPYPNKPKKLFIYTNGNTSPDITINELNAKIEKNLILFGDHIPHIQSTVIVIKETTIATVKKENVEEIIKENVAATVKENVITTKNNNNDQSTLSNILLYLIYHDEKSYQVIKKYENYPYVKLFYNESTKYFESNVWKYLYKNKKEWENKDYVGILTHSFEKKLKRSLDDIYTEILQYIKNYELRVSLYKL